MNAVLTAASAEEFAALCAQIESLQGLLRDRGFLLGSASFVWARVHDQAAA